MIQLVKKFRSCCTIHVTDWARELHGEYIVTDLLKAFLGNGSVNTVNVLQ
jgi:hypothetical protein